MRHTTSSRLTAFLLLLSAPVIADDLATGNRAFAFDIYRRLSPGSGNLFFSPHSISTVMALTAAGARGETEGQMTATLRLPGERKDWTAAYGEIERTLVSRSAPCCLEWTSANSLWPEAAYPLLPAYLELASSVFLSDVHPTDYRDPEAARHTINGWVEERTRDKIRDLIPSGVLNPLTRLVLVNAVYFNAKWLHPFPIDKTREIPFHLADGSQVDTPMMKGKLDARLAERDDMQVLELDYAGGLVALNVVLPRTADGLAALEEQLDAATWDAWLHDLRPSEVWVTLPKFKLSESFQLGMVLRAMGMTDAFNAETADFSGITGARDGLFIGEVLHKAFIDLHEEGTEAAAATAVIMRLTSMPPRTAEFTADRPFLFAIRDKQTGAILFAGRFADPSSIEE